MGGVVHTVMAPIEWAKLLRQTQESNAALPGHPRRQRFQGMVDCVSRTVREEGFLSLWRGNGTSVLRYYPSVALNFSLMDLYRKMLKGGEASVDGRWTSVAGAKFMAGAAAGCTTSAIIYIAHTLRCPPMQGHLPLPPQEPLYFGGLLNTATDFLPSEDSFVG